MAVLGEELADGDLALLGGHGLGVFFDAFLLGCGHSRILPGVGKSLDSGFYTGAWETGI